VHTLPHSYKHFISSSRKKSFSIQNERGDLAERY
jgi:hypothetical protein